MYALAYSGLKLRDITSYMNGITHIDEGCLLVLEKNYTEYITCSSLFLGNVTLSMWTVGFCVTYHSSILLKGLELVLASIRCKEGRQNIRDQLTMQILLFQKKGGRKFSCMSRCN